MDTVRRDRLSEDSRETSDCLSSGRKSELVFSGIFPMDIEAPEGWQRQVYDGFLSNFNIYPPLLTYESKEQETRILAKPVVKRVPSSNSQMTQEELEERVSTGGFIGGEMRQTHWYAATERDKLPVVLPDAPLSDERFEELEWRVAIQPVRTQPEQRDESFRPDTEQVPVVYFDCQNRSSAIQLFQVLLTSEPCFDETEPTWIP